MTATRSRTARASGQHGQQDAQQWLQQYRATLSPDSQARERALQGFAMRLARGESPNVPVQDPPRLPSRRPLLRGRAREFVAVAGACALLGSVGFWQRRSWQQPRPTAADSGARPSLRPSAPTRETPQHASPEAGAASVSIVPQALAAAPQAAPPEPPGTGHRRTSRERAANATTRLVPSTASRVASTSHETTELEQKGQKEPLAVGAESEERGVQTSGIEAELRPMRGAYQALRAGQPGRALDRLDEHAARFPRGELAEARRVARITALCQAGRVALAKAEAEQFLQLSPKSPFAGRVRSLCVEPSVRPSH